MNAGGNERLRLLWRVCSSTALLFASALPALAAPPHLIAPDARIERAATQLAEARSPAAARPIENALQRHLRDRDDAVRATAAAVLAAHHRASGRRDEAARLVAPWADLHPDNLVPGRLEALLEHARIEAERGHALAAFRILDWVRERANTGLPAIVVRIALADCVELAPDYARAHAWLKEALEHGDRWANPGAVSETDARPARPEGAGRWDAWRAGILRRMAELDFRVKIDRWGEEYAYYWRAQHARKADHPLATDFTDTARLYPGEGAGRARVPEADEALALEYYDAIIAKHPETVFAEAAGLYRAFCLVKLGRSAEAERDLERFIAARPMGLYRGEALLTLGDVALQERWDPRAARTRYEQALDWCGRVKGLQDGARLYAVPEKARDQARAPGAWQTMQPSGVIARERMPPDAVINRDTAPWYLDRLQAELRYRLGFLDALAGNWDAALAHWRNVAEHDPLLARAQQQRYFNTLRRLEGAAKNRYFVGEDEENARIAERVRPAIWWADFCHMRERFDEAESLYRRLHRAADARNDGVIAARAGLGLMLRYYGEAMRHERDRQDALMARARETGEAVLDRFPRNPASAYVAFMIGYATPSTSAAGRAAFERVVRDYPRSRHAAEARFRPLMAAVAPSNLEQYLPAIEAFRRDFPDSTWTRLLDDEVEYIHEHRRLYGGNRPGSTKGDR
jgi:tetratricopeptide (TPR) repeat protein